MPAICLNISPATRLDELPLPKLSLPGSFFASATNVGDASCTATSG